jgi:hypothetical protein
VPEQISPSNWADGAVHADARVALDAPNRAVGGRPEDAVGADVVPALAQQKLDGLHIYTSVAAALGREERLGKRLGRQRRAE